MNTIISPVKSEERSKLGIKSGDTVKVHQKVIERGKTRIQIFEGLVISVKHGSEAGGTFAVRTTLSGIGVEKTFPLYTPLIEKIEIVKRSKVRRAKLYFIREKAAKAVRRQLRNARIMNISTDDFAEKETQEKVEESVSEVVSEKTSEETATDSEKENPEASDKKETAKDSESKEEKVSE
ncbi:LSU ribosomal protein L19p [hydrothermal vent metagenome]|uniref:LSU ribosomal protein L19p n=1 Tax=hydrothermal vent metagenome TaxID=652676 RepID=A0A3B0UVX8_9ZZZZ